MIISHTFVLEMTSQGMTIAAVELTRLHVNKSQSCSLTLLSRSFAAFLPSKGDEEESLDFFTAPMKI